MRSRDVGLKFLFAVNGRGDGVVIFAMILGLQKYVGKSGLQVCVTAQMNQSMTRPSVDMEIWNYSLVVLRILFIPKLEIDRAQRETKYILIVANYSDKVRTVALFTHNNNIFWSIQNTFMGNLTLF